MCVTPHPRQRTGGVGLWHLQVGQVDAHRVNRPRVAGPVIAAPNLEIVGRKRALAHANLRRAAELAEVPIGHQGEVLSARHRRESRKQPQVFCGRRAVVLRNSTRCEEHQLKPGRNGQRSCPGAVRIGGAAQSHARARARVALRFFLAPRVMALT